MSEEIEKSLADIFNTWPEYELYSREVSDNHDLEKHKPLTSQPCQTLETLLFQETIPLGVCTAARETAGTAHQRDIKPKDVLSTFKRRIASYLSQWNIWAHIPHSLEKLLLH